MQIQLKLQRIIKQPRIMRPRAEDDPEPQDLLIPLARAVDVGDEHHDVRESRDHSLPLSRSAAMIAPSGSSGYIAQSMPVYHFTLHAYRSWRADNKRGYVKEREVKKPDPKLQKKWDKRAKLPPVEFDD